MSKIVSVHSFRGGKGKSNLSANLAVTLARQDRRVIVEGDSESLPMLLEVSSGDETRRFDLKLSGGQVVLPVTGDPCRVTMTPSGLAPN
jgi:hypothetical protein